MISACDYRDVIENAQKGDFIYLDPPYGRFTEYTRKRFRREDQIQLAEVFRKLSDRGCFVLLSNSDTPFIRELYSDFTIKGLNNVKEVKAKRSINCKGDKRTGKDLIISNYSTTGNGNGSRQQQKSLDAFLSC
jgi:DNA adenine methylase